MPFSLCNTYNTKIQAQVGPIRAYAHQNAEKGIAIFKWRNDRILEPSPRLKN